MPSSLQVKRSPLYLLSWGSCALPTEQPGHVSPGRGDQTALSLAFILGTSALSWWQFQVDFLLSSLGFGNKGPLRGQIHLIAAGGWGWGGSALGLGPKGQLIKCCQGVLVRALWRHGTSRINRDMSKRGFIIGIGSHSYRGQEVPWSAVCKLENPGSW